MYAHIYMHVYRRITCVLEVTGRNEKVSSKTVLCSVLTK